MQQMRFHLGSVMQVDREEKNSGFDADHQRNPGVTISVNGQEVGDKQEVKINKSDVLDIHIDWAIDNDKAYIQYYYSVSAACYF